MNGRKIDLLLTYKIRYSLWGKYSKPISACSTQISFKGLCIFIRYLKTAPGKGVMFQKNEDLRLEAYTDANKAGSMVDRRSTTGHCTFLGGDLITWRREKNNQLLLGQVQKLSLELWPKALWVTVYENCTQDLIMEMKEPRMLYCDNETIYNLKLIKYAQPMLPSIII